VSGAIVPGARRARLGLALSPYHLTSREIPAMLASLLGDVIVTLLPVDAALAERQSATSPGLAGLMDAWSWSAPLWDSGLIGSRLHDDDPRPEIERVLDEINADPTLAPLRPFVRAVEGEDPRRWLERIASDLMRGGPDPGLCVPMSAAIDRFASTRGIAVVRAAPSSLAQRAEERLATRVFGLAIPVLAEAPPERLLETRVRLAPELDALRESISCAFAGALGRPEPGASPREVAEAYTRAFERHRDDLTRPPDDPDDPRIVDALVTVTGVLLPADAVLRSSLSAVRRARGVRAQTPAMPEERLASIIVRRVGR
jgi:hypothetical protein